jgi:hypothetical protein
MRLSEILNTEQDVEEAKPSKSYCKDTPASDMSASWLASCKSRGHKERSGKKSHKLGKGKKAGRVEVGGKTIKGKKYGGPLPDWS